MTNEKPLISDDELIEQFRKNFSDEMGLEILTSTNEGKDWILKPSDVAD